MKTETINGVQITTCYGYTTTGSTADLEPMASLDALRARIMEDTPAASRFMVQQVLNAKEENAQRAIAYSMATHPVDKGYSGWAVSIVVARAEVRLQCCRGETTTHPPTPTFQGVELPYIRNMERTAADRMTTTEESVE